MVSKFPLDGVDELIRTGANYHSTTDAAPLFKNGDLVCAVNINPTTHTRLPAYARGKRGTIVKNYGVYVLPDAVAHDLGEKGQFMYNVEFEAGELWGADAPHPADKVYLSMFEDYIIAAEA
ncbi:SH3-like domain-containing protein [Acidisoma silvae]|nr:SH3-like domain-containing protein [Acidisoma silvae]